MSQNHTSTQQEVVDVRGPRFAAWITATVLATTMLVAGVSATAAAVMLSLQAVVFAIGAWYGPRQHPYGLVFKTLVAPRLGPVTEREPIAPLKFAQFVGLLFAVVGVAGFVSGLPVLGMLATAGALAASFLNAAFGICLGCQLYPLITRLRRVPQTPTR
ncbi:MAG: DUF4395 domain-containing protein [Mycobacteriaceae bacterium]|nr:DUF4395 domain-containing protein [Mycobacteriaceae bacterium]